MIAADRQRAAIRAEGNRATRCGRNGRDQVARGKVPQLGRALLFANRREQHTRRVQGHAFDAARVRAAIFKDWVAQRTDGLADAAIPEHDVDIVATFDNHGAAGGMGQDVARRWRQCGRSLFRGSAEFGERCRVQKLRAPRTLDQDAGPRRRSSRPGRSGGGP